MREVIAIPDKGEADLQLEIQGALQARQIVVNNDASRDAALAMRQRIKDLIAAVDQFFGDVIAQANALHKNLCAKRRSMTTPLEQAEIALNGQVVAYERFVRAEAEKERLRLEAERAKAQQAALDKAEEARKREVAALKKAGDAKAAKELQRAPLPVPEELPVVVPPVEPRQLHGAALRKIWRAAVNNAALIPREWMVPDLAALNAYARSRKEAAVGSIPGVTFTCEETLVSKSE